MAEKEKQADYYVTKGKKVGRILRCNTPFYHGEGKFGFSSEMSDWEQVAGAPLSEQEIREAIAQFRQSRIESLNEVVSEHAHHGYFLEEIGQDTWQLMEVPPET